ncbi:hypothetical protein [Ruegeria arenilitoris]|uniref:hypothetical protein n=1 Tax=Ruegeria arenilitoris TaxID=1173585 RepID=UPI00147F764B|nr:hypothetical protein [Ruegeria arenilitoris]
MSHLIKLTHAESEGLKLALAQLIDERDLFAAIALVETSIEFARTDNSELREVMFKSLFALALANPAASSIDRLLH